MNSNVEFEAKTADDAVELACKELGVSKKQLKYDVLSYGSTGIFGLVGVKKARIRVYPPLASTEEPPTGRKQSPAKGRGRKPKKAAKTTQAPVSQEEVGGEPPPEVPEIAGTVLEQSPPHAVEEDNGEIRASSSLDQEETPVQDPAGLVENRTEPTADQEPEDSQDQKDEDGDGQYQEDGDEDEQEPAEDDPNLEQCMDLAVEASVTMARTIAKETTGKANQNSDGDIVVTLECEKPAVLIGRRGQTLDAIQYLVEKIVNRARANKLRIRVDAGDYLAKREDTLTKQAQRLGAKVRKSGKPASFSPMSAHDRRIVHLALKNEKGLRTQSRGSGYLRKLIIFPQKGQPRKPS